MEVQKKTKTLKPIMASTMLNVVTYNLHGLAQGHGLLSNMRHKAGIIFVQEHWLPSFSLDTLSHDMDGMLCYASSAMDNIVSTGLLRGRPFGGVAVYINNALCAGVKLICKHSRYIILQISDLVLVNAYLPCVGSDTWEHDYMDCLASIANILGELNYTHLIFGGDFNIDFTRKHAMIGFVKDFLSEFNLLLIDDLLPSGSVTYNVDKSGASSFIDHFAVSQQIYDNIISAEIVDSGINLSDHYPVQFSIALDSVPLFLSTQTNSSCKADAKQSAPMAFRWDKADLSLYYSLTYDLLCNLRAPIELLSNAGTDVHSTEVLSLIDNFYDNIVSCLSYASLQTVPRYSKNFFKFWWDEELTLLKESSISTHRLWTNCGKPRSGEIFRKMFQAKHEYKNALKAKEKDRQ